MTTAAAVDGKDVIGWLMMEYQTTQPHSVTKTLLHNEMQEKSQMQGKFTLYIIQVYSHWKMIFYQ